MPIITNNVESEFQRALIERRAGKSTIVDPSNLPKHLQNKMSRRAASGVNMLQEPYYSPFNQRMQYEIPKQISARNQWRRNYYRTEPLVAAALSLHAEFPLSRFRIQHESKDVEDFFNDMIEDLRLFEFVLQMGLEYWIIGEVFPFGFFDDPDDPTIWESFIMLNPDNIVVNPVPISGHNQSMISLIPDASIRKVVENGIRNKETGDIYRQLPPDLVQAVKKKTNLPLDPLCVSHIKSLGSYFDTRGISIIDRVFKTLMYKDRLRETQYAMSTRYIQPTELWKIGTENDPADAQEIADFTEILQQTWSDPNRAIVYHHAVQAEILGMQQSFPNLDGEFNHIENEILTGLMVSKTFLMGEGPTYAGLSVALDVLTARYMVFRQRIESWLEDHVFAPICHIHKIYKPQPTWTSKIQIKNLKPKPYVPQVMWEKAELTDVTAKMQILSQLHDKGLVSADTLLTAANLLKENEESKINNEKGTVFDMSKAKQDAFSGMPTDMSMPSDMSSGEPMSEEEAIEDVSRAVSPRSHEQEREFNPQEIKPESIV